MFALDLRLAADTRFVTDLALSRLLLMDDQRYPWLILVPRLAGANEIHLLEPAEQSALLAELNLTARLIETCFGSDKINIGALGNIVRQLHVHVVGRREGDHAWPGPVWGNGKALPYSEEAGGKLVSELRDEIEKMGTPSVA